MIKNVTLQDSLTFLFQKYKWAHFTGWKSFSFFLKAPYILRTTYFSGDNGG